MAGVARPDGHCPPAARDEPRVDRSDRFRAVYTCAGSPGCEADAQYRPATDSDCRQHAWLSVSGYFRDATARAGTSVRHATAWRYDVRLAIDPGAVSGLGVFFVPHLAKSGSSFSLAHHAGRWG